MTQRHSGYERLERDAYMTPTWATDILTREIATRLRPGATIWEPAAGTGQMAQALQMAGYRVVSSDIHAPTDSGTLQSNRLLVGDFLDEGCPFLPFGFDAIVTNPPYKRAEDFVRRALALTRPTGGLVAMLLGAKFDWGKTRSDIFSDCPAWGLKIVIVDRIVWFDPQPGDSSPSEDHAWYVWDWRGQFGRSIRYAGAPADVLADIAAKRRRTPAQIEQRSPLAQRSGKKANARRVALRPVEAPL